LAFAAVAFAAVAFAAVAFAAVAFAAVAFAAVAFASVAFAAVRTSQRRAAGSQPLRASPHRLDCCFLLLLFAFCFLLFSCHPSPQAEDLLLFLPLPSSLSFPASSKNLQPPAPTA
jgi:hypothetical protein